MNWWMIAGAVVIAWIGGCMIVDGDSYLTRWLGLSAVVFSGILMSFGLGVPEWQGYIKPDEKACAQYTFITGEWTCIPMDQAG